MYGRGIKYETLIISFATKLNHDTFIVLEKCDRMLGNHK